DLTRLDYNGTYSSGFGDVSWAAKAGRTYFIQVGTWSTRQTNPALTSTTLSLRTSTSDLTVRSHIDTPDPVTTGQRLQYQVIADDYSGEDRAFGVTLTQNLPSNVTYTGIEYDSAGAGNCALSGAATDGTGGTVTCTLGAFNPGADWYV